MTGESDQGGPPKSQGDTAGGSAPVLPQGGQTPSSGKRQALSGLRRELSDEDLKNPGVQKLLLQMLENADEECASLRDYQDRYHDVNTRCAVLAEKLRTHTAIDVFFGVGVGLGGTIMGLAPFFWDSVQHGWIVLVVGGLLVVGATIGRVIKR